MQRWRRILVIAGISVLSATAVRGASPEDGKAAFERREDTMKRMGRPFYLGIGRVVKRGLMARHDGAVAAPLRAAPPHVTSGAIKTQPDALLLIG